MEAPLIRVPSQEERLRLALAIARRLMKRHDEQGEDRLRSRVAAVLDVICVIPAGERRFRPRVPGNRPPHFHRLVQTAANDGALP